MTFTLFELSILRLLRGQSCIGTALTASEGHHICIALFGVIDYYVFEVLYYMRSVR